MIRKGTGLQYNNQVLVAHRLRNITYRAGPGHKVQLIVPSVPPPGPQSTVIQTVRPTMRRSNASLNVRAMNGWVASTEAEAVSEPTKAEDAETEHMGNQKSGFAGHGDDCYLGSQVRVSHEEDRPTENDLCAADPCYSNSDNRLRGDIADREAAPRVAKTYSALCAADLEDSGDEDALCDDDDVKGLGLECNSDVLCDDDDVKGLGLKGNGDVLCDDDDVKGLGLEGNSRLTKREKELVVSQGRQQAMTQLRIQENMLREIARQEGFDFQTMARKSFGTLMRKATRLFRPSGISVGKTEQTQSLEEDGQMGLRLLGERGHVDE